MHRFDVLPKRCGFSQLGEATRRGPRASMRGQAHGAQLCSGRQAQAWPPTVQPHCGPQAQVAAAAVPGGTTCTAWQPQRQLAPGQLVHWQEGLAVVFMNGIS